MTDIKPPRTDTQLTQPDHSPGYYVTSYTTFDGDRVDMPSLRTEIDLWERLEAAKAALAQIVHLSRSGENLNEIGSVAEKALDKLS